MGTLEYSYQLGSRYGPFLADRARTSSNRAEAEQEAYQRLRNESRRLRRPIRELAEAVLLADSLGRGEVQP